MSGTDPEETTPFTHRPYGSTPDDQPHPPPTPPSPSPSSWETYQQPQPPTYPQTPSGQPPYGEPTYSQPTYSQPAFGQYGQYGQYGQSPYVAGMQHPQAHTALVLGIVALAGTFVCGVLCVVGPFAWSMGAKVRREIDAEPQRWSGRGEATAGYVMGIIATILMVLAILAVLFFFLVILAAAP